MLCYILIRKNLTEAEISKMRFSGKNTSAQLEKQWHIGQTVPLIQEGYEVSEVQADGDELDYLLDNLSGLPMSKSPVVSWFGDMAKFIIHNIPVGMTWDKVNQKTVRIR